MCNSLQSQLEPRISGSTLEADLAQEPRHSVASKAESNRLSEKLRT